PDLTPTTPALTIGDHTLRVIVTGQCGSVTNSATLSVNAGTTATAPSDATVCQGSDASFSTVASGTGPFSYQWSLDGAAAGSDAGSLSVPTSGLSIGDHSVSVVVSGACGSMTNSVTLTVHAPTSASGPNNLERQPGQSASFSTSASGDGPFTYQWRKDGVEIADATNATYRIASVSAAEAGTYSVAISGACNGVTNSAFLSVDECMPLTSGIPQWNPQTDLFEQKVRISNPTEFTFTAVQVLISGMREGVRVYNASGTNVDGVQFVQYNQPLGPGQTANLTIEYY